MKKALIIIAIVLAIAGVGIYKLVNSLGAAGEKADTFIAGFHRDFNAPGGSDAIYKSAGDTFKKSIPQAGFTAMITTIRDKIGSWKSGERTGINLATNNGNTQLEIQFTCTYERGTGEEQFIFDYNGSDPVLIGWHLTSPELIEKPAAATPAAPAEPAETEPASAPQ